MKTIISALALAACSRANDASALANEIKALEIESDSLDNWLHRWTAVVVVGLVMEFWAIFHVFHEEKIAFKRGTICSPARPSILNFAIEILATLLITVGVFGEFWVGAKVSSISALLRSKGHELESIMAKEVADTRERAAKSEGEAARARKDAADAILLAKKYEAGIATANAGVAEAGRQAAEASRIAEGERLARVKIEQRLKDRNLSVAEQTRIENKLKPFSGTPYELAVTPVPEAISLITTIDGLLRASGWANKESAKTEFRFTFTLGSGSKVEQVYSTGILVQVTKPVADKHGRAIDALILALRAEGLTVKGELLKVDDPSPNNMHIVVGSK